MKAKTVCEECGKKLGYGRHCSGNCKPQKEAQHTPTPKIDTDALMTCLLGIGYLPERAAYIVRAVNAYEKDQEIKAELITKLSLAVYHLKSVDDFGRAAAIESIDELLQAIAKAEGK